MRFRQKHLHARPNRRGSRRGRGRLPLSMIRLALFLKKLSILFSPHEKASSMFADRGIAYNVRSELSITDKPATVTRLKPSRSREAQQPHHHVEGSGAPDATRF